MATAAANPGWCELRITSALRLGKPDLQARAGARLVHEARAAAVTLGHMPHQREPQAVARQAARARLAIERLEHALARLVCDAGAIVVDLDNGLAVSAAERQAHRAA